MHFSPLLLHTPGLFFLPPCSYFLFRLSLPVRLFLLSFPAFFLFRHSPAFFLFRHSSAFFLFRHSSAFFFFVIPRLDRGICKGDVRLKAEHDRKRKEAEHDKENTRHGLTICTQKASRFNKGSRRSQCRGQAGYSLRASTKARAAASERSRASPCQAGYSLRYTFF